MPTGRTNLQITLPSDNASASYSFDTYDLPDIEDGYVNITYLGKTAKVAVNSYRYSGIDDGEGNGNRLYSCSGVDYNSRLYNARISYYIQWENWGGTWITPKLREHFQKIANALGLTLVWIVSNNFDVPCEEPLTITNAGTENETRREYHTGTLSELIDRLIGWSRDVPSMQYAVRISGNYLNVVQRGAENITTNIDANGAIRAYPTFNVRKYFSAWSDSSGYIYSSDPALTKEPFTGTIEYPPNSPTNTLTYENGYLMSEEHSDANGTSTTNYTYRNADSSSSENAKYLVAKSTQSTEYAPSESEGEGSSEEEQEIVGGSRSQTTYLYYETENEKYLGEEHEMIYAYDADTDIWELTSDRRTVHAPLGNGWYGTTVYENKDTTQEIISTSLSQGAPGGKVSQYMVDAQQEGLTDSNHFARRRAAISGVARARATFPVSDYSTLSAIASAMNWLNGSDEITVSLDLFHFNSVIDIDQKVTFQSKTWRVQQNVIEFTPTQTVQHLNLIRWEK